MKKVKQLRFFEQSSSFKVVKEEFNTLLTDRNLKKVIQLIFILLSLDFLIFGLVWAKIPPQIPLFYSRPWGEEQLINKNSFIILPLSCLIFVLINLRIASTLFRKEVLLSQILVWSSLVVSILTSIGLLKIMTIVL